MISDLYKIATAFRVAINVALKAGEIKELCSFSRGCCTYVGIIMDVD